MNKKNRLNHIVCILFFIFQYLNTQGQELNCSVEVNADVLITNQATEKTVFTDLQKAISGFMNNQQWTDDTFDSKERIDCKLLVTLRNSPAQNQFSGNIQIQATRPIYNTNYTTNTLLYLDNDFTIEYIQGTPLIFNINSYTNNLTSMLAFYAYTILAIDYDTFSKEGGNPYIEKAFNIVNIAQQASNNGWSGNQGSTINRYWLSENMNNQQMLPFRQAIYDYHRKGLDLFLIDAKKARENILNALKTIAEVNKRKPSAVFTNIFFDAKSSELINIFKKAPEETRKEVRNLLVKLDPGKTIKYNELLKNQ